MRCVSMCEVCGQVFVWLDKGVRQTRCRKHRKLRNIPARGYYAVITFVDGLSADQEDFLARMMDRRLTKKMLEDFVITHVLDGAVVQHCRSRALYRVFNGGMVKINNEKGILLLRQIPNLHAKLVITNLWILETSANLLWRSYNVNVENVSLRRNPLQDAVKYFNEFKVIQGVY